MPDFYAAGEYDLSGFAVGIVKKDSVIDGKNIEVGDVLIGLPSSGVHSNGFSLVRRFNNALKTVRYSQKIHLFLNTCGNRTS